MAIAAHRGVPVTVYRPSFIGWHSGTGAFNDRDFVCGLLTGCLELGAAPEMDMMVDAAPVDYVSRAIVHLGSRQGSAGKVFHLHNPERIAWNDLVGLYVSLGARLKPEPYEAWLGRVEQARNSDFQERFASVLPVTSASGNSWIFDALSEARIQRFDRRNVAEALASTGIECPRWDAPLVKAHLTRLLPPG
jgi:thioester reductase-like protein